MNDDQNQQLPVWPPAIVSNPTEAPRKNTTTQAARTSLRGLLFGLFCGFVLSLVIGVGIMIVCMKIGGAMSMEGTPSNVRATIQEVAKIIEFLLLGWPVLAYIMLRNNSSFALGILIGSFLPDLGFIKLFFF